MCKLIRVATAKEVMTKLIFRGRQYICIVNKRTRKSTKRIYDLIYDDFFGKKVETYQDLSAEEKCDILGLIELIDDLDDDEVLTYLQDYEEIGVYNYADENVPF